VLTFLKNIKIIVYSVKMNIFHFLLVFFISNCYNFQILGQMSYQRFFWNTFKCGGFKSNTINSETINSEAINSKAINSKTINSEAINSKTINSEAKRGY